MISLRLQRAAQYTKGFACLVDCGTDHGKLPIYCVENDYVKTAFASDNKEGPLQNAIKNIKRSGLEKRISVILADGLPFLNSEIDVVSILGMGGRLIVTILKNANLTSVKRLVLIANSENYLLREHLQNHQWRIVAEELIKENHKFYQLVVAEPGEMQLTENEKEFGPIIIKEKSASFLEMIKKLIKQLETGKKQTTSPETLTTIDLRIKQLMEVIS